MIVVVTGASAGVGRATALELARQGCNIAILARNAARLETAAAELRCLASALFQSSPMWPMRRALDAAADCVEKELGPIDVWVNNAMATIFAPIQRISQASQHPAARQDEFDFGES
jgi:NAD(P)-dependent dehydrogenase (short-subunit alcohol dehydrogenase family)